MLSLSRFNAPLVAGSAPLRSLDLDSDPDPDPAPPPAMLFDPLMEAVLSRLSSGGVGWGGMTCCHVCILDQIKSL